MAASLIFPIDYKGAKDSGPMLGFGACEILESSGVAKLALDSPKQWAWLPVPPEGISTSYQQGWEESQVNIIAAATTKATSWLGDMMGGGDKKTAADSVKGGDRAGQATNTGVLNLGSAATAGAELLKAKMGLAVGIDKRALEQTYVSYSGPQYRSHSFAFSLKPKSKKESEAIKEIVKFFKVFSAPTSMGGVADIIRLYKNPHLFLVKMAPTSTTFPKIGASALTGFDVKYGGDKFAVFEGNEPVQVDISLSFKEMIILDSEKVEDGY